MEYLWNIEEQSNNKSLGQRIQNISNILKPKCQGDYLVGSRIDILLKVGIALSK